MNIIIAHVNIFGSWSGAQTRNGSGGTEEAILYLTQELANLGNDVTISTNLASGSLPEHNGVKWVDYDTFTDYQSADVIVFTSKDFMPTAMGPKYYFWLHIDHDERIILDLADRIHKIIPLSQVSRRNYPNVSDSKVFVSRNGIAVKDLDRPVARQKNRICYGSDYDRGLIALLEYWPHVRRHTPDAELRIFYGWSHFDKKMEDIRLTSPEYYPAWEKLKARILHLMQQDGVTHLGRISHVEVANEFLSASIWAYPCMFPETSCITAMKAQAAGAIPVVIPTAALEETVKFGFRTRRRLANSRHLDSETYQDWGNALLTALSNPDLEDLRGQMIAFSRNYFDWSNVAREWQEEFLLR